MPLPDFLCIGAQKSATTWLAVMLRQHPNIWMPPIKEVHFFDKMAGENRELRRYRELAEKRKTSGIEKGLGPDFAAYLDRVTAFDEVSLAWYQAVFSWPVRAGVKTGEITPAYLEISEAGVRYARETLGDIKIMAIIRHPLDRELSNLRMAASLRMRKHGGPETDRDWMQIYDRMVRKRPRGAYSRGIPLWQGAFSEKNFLAIPFADVRESPQALMEQVEDFLGVPNFGSYYKLEKRVHKTKNKLLIPQVVIDRAAERVAGEDAFLRQHFGEDFYLRTK